MSATKTAVKGTVFIINGGIKHVIAGGTLNLYLTNVAKETLEKLGYKVVTTNIGDGYEISVEVAKLKESNIVILQTPVWWLGLPGKVKSYLDDVLMNCNGILWASDGRTRQDPSKHYGSGGLAMGRKFLISSTWNAPEEAFTKEGQFFSQTGKDKYWDSVEKIFKFCGYDILPGMFFFDVVKNPQIERDTKNYIELLKKNFT